MSTIKGKGRCASSDRRPRACQLQATVREAMGNRIILGVSETPDRLTLQDRMEICLTPEQSMRLGHRLLQIGKSLRQQLADRADKGA